MVHANVGQKLLIHNKIKSFLDVWSWALNTVPMSTYAIQQPLLHSLLLSLTPPTNYILTSDKPLSFVLNCNTPIENRGRSVDLRPLCMSWQEKKLEKKGKGISDWCLLEQLFARWWHPVASSEALDLFYWAMSAVLYRRTAAAINTASFLGQFVDCCLFACCPDSCWGTFPVRGSAYI